VVCHLIAGDTTSENAVKRDPNTPRFRLIILGSIGKDVNVNGEGIAYCMNSPHPCVLGVYTPILVIEVFQKDHLQEVVDEQEIHQLF